MTRLEQTTLIPAPVDEVFRYASDWQKWAEWFDGVSDFRVTTTVGRGDGARYAYKARILGVTASVETEVAEFVEGRGWKGIGRKGVPHTTYWTFEPIDRATRFTYALEYEIPVPILGRLMDDLFVKREWRRIIATSLANLTRYFEGRSLRTEGAAGGHGA